jgi:ribonuclease PH
MSGNIKIIRPITSELNILTRSDGSAIITQGEPYKV